MEETLDKRRIALEDKISGIRKAKGITWAAAVLAIIIGVIGFIVALELKDKDLVYISSFPFALGLFACFIAWYIDKDLPSLQRQYDELSGRSTVTRTSVLLPAEQESRFCKYCGQSISLNANFCEKCGKKI